MANNPGARKRIRQIERRTLHNKMIKSKVRTALRRFRETLVGSDKDAAKSAYSLAASALDKAAKVGIIHPNQADRRKSRLAQELSAKAGA